MSRDALLLTSGMAVGAALAYVYSKQATAASPPPNLRSEPEATVEDGRTGGSLKIPAADLRSFVAAVFVKCGVKEDEAETAAEVLILADVRGIDSHGIARLAAYYNMLTQGIINPRPVVTIVRETDSTATVDGDNGLGLIVGPKANAIAMEKASKAGSGWVAVRNTNHYGIAGGYSLAALEKDMIGISMTNSGSVVAPLWGRQRMLGTNPIAIAFPGEKERPMVIDFATSVVPWGKVEEHARKGEQLLPGWAICANGEQELSPEKVLGSGALMNLGGDREHSGHKGFCLAAMVDVLCAVLSGGNWGPTVDGFTTHKANYGDETEAAGASFDEPQQSGEEEKAVGIGHFFGAMRIDGFRDVRSFKRTMDTWMTTFRACAPVDPNHPVLVPGDPEWEASDVRSAEGVPVKLSVLADLLDVARGAGVPPPFDEAAVDLGGIKRVKVERA